MEYRIYLVEEGVSGPDISSNAKSGMRAPRLHFTRQNRIFEFDRKNTEGLLAAIPDSKQTSPLAIALKRYLSCDSASNKLYLRTQLELDEIWKSGDKKTRCGLLENKDFLWMLNEKQAEDICAYPDTEVLKSIYKGMHDIGNSILPASPRLSTATRLKLIKLAIVAHDPNSGNRSNLNNLIRERISIDSAERIFTHDFPMQVELEAFEQCFLPIGSVYGSALTLAKYPLESTLFGIVQHYVWNKESTVATYALQLRYGKWEKLVFNIGTDEFALGLADICLICDYCELENSCPEFITSLFQIGHPEITKRIIWSGMLTRTQEDEAWEQGNIDVCRKLLDSPTFLYGITDSQAEDIININDVNLLQSLACKIQYLYEEWNDIPERRLSVYMRDHLLQFLKSHPDKDVKRLIEIYGKDLIPNASD